MYEIKESILNHIDIRDIEDVFPDRYIPVLPIGIAIRYDRFMYVVQNSETTLYSGNSLESACKALEKYQGTIIYSKINNK